VAWESFESCAARVPAALAPWLAEPGLLTARVRAACEEGPGFRLLRLAPATMRGEWREALACADTDCLLREIEFSCGAQRWIYAQTVLPRSTVVRHPFLERLGDVALGEALAGVDDVRREPLEYTELTASDPLAVAAVGPSPVAAPLWARRAVYRIGQAPILVQEVFLPVLATPRGDHA